LYRPHQTLYDICGIISRVYNISKPNHTCRSDATCFILNCTQSLLVALSDHGFPGIATNICGFEHLWCSTKQRHSLLFTYNQSNTTLCLVYTPKTLSTPLTFQSHSPSSSLSQIHSRNSDNPSKPGEPESHRSTQKDRTAQSADPAAYPPPK
jgi:hypothetical protein